MRNAVMIKGNQYGIVLVLNPDISFPMLCEEIRKKFEESNKFFNSKVQMAISFDGRELTNTEQNHIIEIINDACDLNISYVIDKDAATEQLFAEQIAARQSIQPVNAFQNVTNTIEPSYETQNTNGTQPFIAHADINTVGSVDNLNTKMTKFEVGSDDLGHFYRGNLRSGQNIEFASSIVVVGDVNPGAKVVAKGNIIIIGSLKGSAYAGIDGKPNSFIIALDMDPMQLRIGNLYARSPDAVKGGLFKKKKQTSHEMQIAFVEGDNIYIEPINRSVLNNII